MPLFVERLRHLFLYDAETGVFTRRIAHAGRPAGAPVGTINAADGYVVVSIDGRTHRAHRLAWLYVTGEWPTGMIDHFNGDRSDNRFSNLRDATHGINMQNQRRAAGSNRSSGLLGVTAKRNRWAAQLWANGKNVYCGTFNTPEQAHAAYVEAKRRLHPGNSL